MPNPLTVGHGDLSADVAALLLGASLVPANPQMDYPGTEVRMTPAESCPGWASSPHPTPHHEP